MKLLNVLFMYLIVIGVSEFNESGTEENTVTDGKQTIQYRVDKNGNIRCDVLSVSRVKAEKVRITAVTTLTMNRLLKACRRHHVSKRGLMFPGTKWCGGGNIASNYSDLGFRNETDACCRDHDNCDIQIDAYSHRYNLHNRYPFTRVSCDCDKEFYYCLKNASEDIAKYVGGIYFNFLRPTCLNPTRKSKCVHGSLMRWLRSRCDDTALDLEWKLFNLTF